MQKLKLFITNLWHLLRLPEMLILPGNLAFYLILSLAPLITLFSIISSSLSISIDGFVNFFGSAIPSSVTELLMPLVDGSGLNAGNFIFTTLGFYIASNGQDSLIIAANMLYETEQSSYIKRKVKAIFLTIWILILFLVILLLMAFGSFILTKILTFGVIGKFISQNYSLITAIKLLLAFVVIFMFIKLIYTMAPDIKLKSKYVNFGALFATLAIMVVTSIYSFYVNNLAHYDAIYKGLASIAILMLLIYIISYILVLGMVINKNYYKMNK